MVINVWIWVVIWKTRSFICEEKNSNLWNFTIIFKISVKYSHFSVIYTLIILVHGEILMKIDGKCSRYNKSLDCRLKKLYISSIWVKMRHNGRFTQPMMGLIEKKSRLHLLTYSLNSDYYCTYRWLMINELLYSSK